MMEKIFLCNNPGDIERVYPARVREHLGISPEVFTADTLKENSEKTNDARFAFSTWGMPKLTEQEIKKYLPSLEAVFYAAGTVNYFAEPYLKNGVRIFSAAYANGIPVAEYTLAQIILACKGFFRSEKLYKTDLPQSKDVAWNAFGNYRAKVGLIGLGVIGSMVAERLKQYDIGVFAYDPFAPVEKADRLGVTLVSLKELFAECDVVSNHLANKEELNDILNYRLFSLMKNGATFINTGRGAQVNEEDLARALNENPTLSALLDVQKDERNPASGPLFACANAFMTPHIAGSMGYEVTRMADFMSEQYDKYVSGETPAGEITLGMLETTA